MIYLIGDTHFSEENIIRYEDRPFKNADEMDAAIINYWNRMAKDNDEVWHFGDFGAEGHEAEILSQLKGIKYLIKGNHDIQSNEYYRKAGFAEVYDKPILYNNFWLFSHEPMYVNSHMPYVNVFAHVHGSSIYADYGPNHFCVSMERIGYIPIELQKVADKIMKADRG